MTANIDGSSLAKYYSLDTLDTAAWLGFLAVITLALGMRLVCSGRRYTKTLRYIEVTLSDLNLNRVLFTYLLVTIINALLVNVGQEVPAVKSIVHALSFSGYAVAFLVFWAFVHNENFKRFGLVVLLFEIARGFFGFFGSFKSIIFIFTVAYLTKQKKRAK